MLRILGVYHSSGLFEAQHHHFSALLLVTALSKPFACSEVKGIQLMIEGADVDDAVGYSR